MQDIDDQVLESFKLFAYMLVSHFSYMLDLLDYAQYDDFHFSAAFHFIDSRGLMRYFPRGFKNN